MKKRETNMQTVVNLSLSHTRPSSPDRTETILTALSDSSGALDPFACAQLFAGGAKLAQQTIADVLSGSPDDTAAAVTDRIHTADVRLTGAEVVAVLLGQAGVKRAFAYPGTSELSLCDALEALPSVMLVNGRGDKESAFMAAGSSLLSPNLGTAVLHAARGLTNAAGALADARRNEVGTVFIVGLPSTSSIRFLPPHGEIGLIGSLGTFAKFAWEAPEVPTDPPMRARAAATFVAKLRHAATVAATAPAGPVLFGVSQDVAEARWIPLAALAAEPEPASVAHLDVEPALRLLRDSQRPVFLVDDYALRSEGIRTALDRVSGHTGAAVLQLRYRRGPMLFERLQTAEVGNFVGWFNQYSPAHRELMDAADLLITVEDRNVYRRVVGDLPGCAKVAINSDPSKARKNEYLTDDDVLIGGNPTTVLTALAAGLEGGRRPAWFPASVGSASAVNPEPAPDDIATGRDLVAGAIADALAALNRPVLIDDSQMFGGLISDYYDHLPLGLRVFGGHGGFVGGGLAYATGLAIAEPEVQVVCTLGDQAFTNSFQGLVAAVQEDARLTLLVCNNGQSVSLNKQAVASYGQTERRYLANVDDFDYQRVAAAIGLSTERVRVPLGRPVDEVEAASSELADALKRANATDGPSLIELVLPSDPQVWRGIWLTQGFEQRPAEVSS